MQVSGDPNITLGPNANDCYQLLFSWTSLANFYLAFFFVSTPIEILVWPLKHS